MHYQGFVEPADISGEILLDGLHVRRREVFQENLFSDTCLPKPFLVEEKVIWERRMDAGQPCVQHKVSQHHGAASADRLVGRLG